MGGLLTQEGAFDMSMKLSRVTDAVCRRAGKRAERGCCGPLTRQTDRMRTAPT